MRSSMNLIGSLHCQFRTEWMAKDVNWRGRSKWTAIRIAYILQEAGMIKLVMGVNGEPISYHITAHGRTTLRKDKVYEAIALSIAKEKLKRQERFQSSLLGRVLSVVLNK